MPQLTRIGEFDGKELLRGRSKSTLQFRTGNASADNEDALAL